MCFGAAGDDDAIDVGSHDSHRLHVGNGLRAGADDADRSRVGACQGVGGQRRDHRCAQGRERRTVEQCNRLADAHVEQHVDALDDRQSTCRVRRLDPDQLHAGRVAGCGRHHQELASAGGGVNPVDMRRARRRNRRATP